MPITLAVNPTSVLPGGALTFTATITGEAAGVPDVLVELKWRASGAVDWTTAANTLVSTDANGYAQAIFNMTVSPTQALGTYEAKATASKGTASLDSNIVTVTVAAPSGVATSHSEIVDMPVFPDDTVPKLLQGAAVDFQWSPFVEFIGTDEQGNPIACFATAAPDSVRYGLYVQGQLFTGTMDISAFSYANGIMVIGTMPRLTVDFHHPHSVKVEMSPTRRIEFTVTYRGPPLWYSKTTNPLDMLQLNKYCKLGGYDAPCSAIGTVYSNGATLNFSGLGVYEHVWMIGDLRGTWDSMEREWIIFNDPNAYGAIVGTRDTSTGNWFFKTGRIWVANVGTFRADDFVWDDDGTLVAPKYIHLTGVIDDLAGNAVGSMNLATDPAMSSNFFPGNPWMMHVIKGTLTGDSTSVPFSGTAWTEVVRHMAVVEPTIEALDNSLEYLRAQGLGVAEAGWYVTCKKWLGTSIASPEQVIAYFDSQQQADGSWMAVRTPMFTTHRILLAYFLLDAKPAKPLDTFMAKYDTWPEVLTYCTSEVGTDLREAYHVLYGWCLYYWKYPGWLSSFWTEVEKDLTWTVGDDFHYTTHVLYCYVLARRAFPNLDAVVDKMLSLQNANGSWGPVYETSIALSMLQQVLKLFPGHKTTEINSALAKAADWVKKAYRTTTVNGKTLGYFGDVMDIENALAMGILCAGQSGVLPTNVDMTFADVVAKIQPPAKYTVAYQSTPITVTLTLDSQQLQPGQSTQVEEGKPVTFKVPSEIEV